MPDCIFQDTSPKWNDTIRDTLQKILCATNDAAGGGGSANGQVMIYTAGGNPNVEALVPTDPTKPAVAYSADGSGAVFGWSGSAWV